jgi:hypothetical protein
MLSKLPCHDRLRFLQRERRENQEWKFCLAGQRLGFLQDALQQFLLRFERIPEFREDGILCLLKLEEELPAGI